MSDRWHQQSREIVWTRNEVVAVATHTVEGETWRCVRQSAHFATGVNDAEGREVGVRVNVWPIPAATWRAQVWSTRDGKLFGAFPPGTNHASEEDAKASGVKRARHAIRRVIRDAQATGGVYLTKAERRAQTPGGAR